MGNVVRLGCVAIAAAGVVALLGAATSGHESGLEARIHALLKSQDDEQAARLIDRHLERSPADAAMLYNAACVHVRLGNVEGGAAYLIRAVKSGFSNISHLRRDPDLRGLHQHPVDCQAFGRVDRARE